jgi:hypothetical protein
MFVPGLFQLLPHQQLSHLSTELRNVDHPVGSQCFGNFMDIDGMWMTQYDTMWQALCQLAEADRIFRALLEKIPLDTIGVLLAIQSVKSSV